MGREGEGLGLRHGLPPVFAPLAPLFAVAFAGRRVRVWTQWVPVIGIIIIIIINIINIISVVITIVVVVIIVVLLLHL